MAQVSTLFNLDVQAGFDEPLFPDNISFGSRGGPGYNTAIVTTDSGAEHRTARWTDALRQYNARYGVRDQDDLSAVMEFYLAREGALGSFRFKDWGDYATTSNHITFGDGAALPDAEDVVFGVGDSSQTEFQLIKRYQDGLNTKIRNITKPRSGTVKIAFDGTLQTAGFSVDTTTGKVTFTIAPATGVQLTWGGEFDVPCRFSTEADKLLSITWNAFKAASASIPIVEIRNESFTESEFFYGGGKDFSIIADFRISVAMGRVLRMTSGVIPNLEIILPLVDDLEPGGPYFYLENSGSNLLRIVPEQGIGLGGELGNLLQDETMIVLLADNAGTKEWVGLL